MTMEGLEQWLDKEEINSIDSLVESDKTLSSLMEEYRSARESFDTKDHPLLGMLGLFGNTVLLGIKTVYSIPLAAAVTAISPHIPAIMAYGFLEEKTWYLKVPAAIGTEAASLGLVYGIASLVTGAGLPVIASLHGVASIVGMMLIAMYGVGGYDSLGPESFGETIDNIKENIHDISRLGNSMTMRGAAYRIKEHVAAEA